MLTACEAQRGACFGARSLGFIRELHDKYAFAYVLALLAGAATFKGNHVYAARILGTRDAVTERAGAPVVDKSVQKRKEHAQREVRARLGPDRWAREYDAGRTTSIDSLMKDIDTILGRRPRRQHTSL